MKQKRGTQIARRLGRLTLTLALAVGLVMPLLVCAQKPPIAERPPLTEKQMKALCVYNFAKSTTWPKEALSETNGTFTLGVIGNNLSDDALKLIRGKAIKDRELVIRKFNDAADAAARQNELVGCHIVFVGASEKANLGDLFRLMDKTNILTVGEVEGFLDQGGVINFVIEKNMLRFEIKHGAAQKANLKLDTQLLKLARTVKD